MARGLWRRRRRPLLCVAALALLLALSLTSAGVLATTVHLQALYPPRRAACDAVVRSERPAAGAPAPRIALVTIFDGPVWTGPMGRSSEANKRAYAARHGYDVVVATGDAIDRSRPVAWSKILAVRGALERGYDWAFFIDCDALIMNPDVDLAWLTAAAEREGKDLVLAEDWNGPNSGVWLLRRTDWALWFLDELYKQTWLVRGPFIFEYEQRAFHFLLDTAQWRGSRAGADYRYKGATQVWEHVQVVPQCVFNSYVLHPATRHDREVSQYVPGDFVVHFAGYKGAAKQALFEHYAGLAASWYG